MLTTYESGPREDAERGTVVFIHGFPFNGSMWEPQLASLPDGWRGLAPDLPGFGRSLLDAGPGDPATGDRVGVADANEPVLTMTHMANAMAEVIDAECDGPAVVCGLSMGGYVAFELLRRRPELVRAFVLADTRAEPESEEGRANRKQVAETVREAGTRPIAAAMLPDLLTRSTRDHAPDVVDTVRGMILDTPPSTVIAALAGMAARPDSGPDLPTIPVPTLVIVGEDDAITPAESARAMADEIPDAKLAIIPGAGHLSNLENPEAFNAALNGLLDRLP